MKNILEKELNIYDDKEVYYLKNSFGNILPVTKVIAMYRFGFIWKPDPGSLVDETTGKRVGKWVKKLPADEGFELVEKKEWEELERKRLRNEVSLTEEPKQANPEDKLSEVNKKNT